MTEKEEHLFQESNNCWICKKLIENDDEKVRDHCHITGKFRGAAHWDCNINFQLTKKVPVIFHNLKGYDSHLIYGLLRFHLYTIILRFFKNNLKPSIICGHFSGGMYISSGFSFSFSFGFSFDLRIEVILSAILFQIKSQHISILLQQILI